MTEQLKRFGQILLPKAVRRRILHSTRRPPVGRVDLGDLRRLKPISRAWGGDRGQPIDRYYIEKFLASHVADIRGRVLEVGDTTYTRKFGADRVTRSEVVDADPGNTQATFTADFADAPQLPSDTFDCIICTQTLQLIPNLAAATGTLFRILKPGGTLLVTLQGISQIYRDASDRWGDYWRFTVLSAKWLFGERFGERQVTVAAYGNVLAATAFLHGLAAEELETGELNYADSQYELVITVRAKKLDPTS